MHNKVEKWKICAKIQYSLYDNNIYAQQFGGCRGRDHMVVGFITTYAISAYHH
jgi:hypothetical protein